MNDLWKKLEAWLAVNAPFCLSNLKQPASDNELDALEQSLGLTLPEDFKEFLKIHNGQSGTGPSLFEQGRLLGTTDILIEWQTWDKLLQSGEFEEDHSAPSPEIKAGWWRPGWVPFLSNGRGDHLCLDMDPTTIGTHGQVIEVLHDVESRQRLAAGFTEWLEIKIKENEA